MNLSVLIPYSFNGEQRASLFEWLLRRYAKLLPEAQVCIGQNEEVPFNRSAARNDAFRQAEGDTLLIADADIVFHRPQILDALAYLEEEPRSWVIPYGTWEYYSLLPETTADVITGPADDDIAQPTSWEHRLQSWAGLLVMPRQAYELVNGYDTRFRSWGCEDNAFQVALDTLWAPHTRLEQHSTLHLWHPRGKEDFFTSSNWPENEALYRKYLEANGNVEAMTRLVNDE